MIAPQSERDLARVIAATGEPLAIRGGGTRAIGGPVDGAPLTTAGLSGVTLYEPGALTLVAGAGTPVSEIEAMLDAENQRLAFEPMDHRALLGTEGVPTLGGIVAGNVSGPRRIQAGACRDFLLGVRFVDGMGRVVKNGGRVMKNVTGYDLVKLMAGSRGTLGVLTEVSFKVMPVPEARATLLIEGLADGDAVAAMTAALGSPFDVSGAAHVQVGPDGAPVTMIRVEGFAASVAYRVERLKDLLGRYGEISVETDPLRTEQGWAHIRDVKSFAGRAGAVWRISVKPSDGPAVAAALPGAELVYDWGGGLLWVLAPPETDVRAALSGIPGHATLVRAEGGAAAQPVFHPEPPALAAISAGLRARFDPRSILNPGLLG